MDEPRPQAAAERLVTLAQLSTEDPASRMQPSCSLCPVVDRALEKRFERADARHVARQPWQAL